MYNVCQNPDSLKAFVKIDPSPRPIHLRIRTASPIIIVPYGLFMGIGFAALVCVSLSFGAPSQEGLRLLPPAINLTLISAVLSARLLSIIMEDGVTKLIASPLRTALRPGFWLHGGLFGAAAGALLAHSLDYVEDFSMFAGSLAMGLPLYETFSRIGCHTYGCCYGRVAWSPSDDSSSSTKVSLNLWRLLPFPAVRYTHPTHYAVTRINPSLLHKPLVPIQLMSATLFFLIFLTVTLPCVHYTSVELTGAITLVCHAALRLITETHRADYRGRENRWLSMTGKMALIQATTGVVWSIMTIMGKTQPLWDMERLESSSIIDGFRECVPKSLFAVGLGIVVYGVHVGEVGSWVAT